MSKQSPSTKRQPDAHFSTHKDRDAETEDTHTDSGSLCLIQQSDSALNREALKESGGLEEARHLPIRDKKRGREGEEAQICSVDNVCDCLSGM